MYPIFKQERVYRFPLAGHSSGEFSWPEFIIVASLCQQFIDDLNQPSQLAILVEVFTVLLSEYKQFVEPFREWELN